METRTITIQLIVRSHSFTDRKCPFNRAYLDAFYLAWGALQREGFTVEKGLLETHDPKENSEE